MKTIYKFLVLPVGILLLFWGCSEFPSKEDYGNPDVNRLSWLLETDNAMLIDWYIKSHEGIDLNLPEKRYCKTLLTSAIESGKYHAAQVLLENGADPNDAYSNPLGVAVLRGTKYAEADADNLRFVLLLLDHGAKVDVEDRNNPLPSSIQIYTRDMSCFKCLVEKGGADIDKRLKWNDSIEVSLLDVAFLRRRLDIMWYMVSEANMGHWLDSTCWDGHNNIMYYLRPEICTYDKENEKCRKKLWEFYERKHGLSPSNEQ